MSSSSSLPYSNKDLYDNAKFRHRSFFQAINQALLKGKAKRHFTSCSTGKFLFLVMLLGVAFLILSHTAATAPFASNVDKNATYYEHNISGGIKNLFRRAPRLPPQLTPDQIGNGGADWADRQESVRKAFVHAWGGYKRFAMGFDELMPLSKQGVDGLGGLGATVVDALDTAMIMGLDEVVGEAGSWIKKHLASRISEKGQVNLFETTIRVLGGLLSAYHFSSLKHETNATVKGPEPGVYLETAKNLADRLMTGFTSSPTVIPYGDVVLRDPSAHPAPDGLSSTSEVSTLQLEFNYLSTVSNDPKYSVAAMKVLEHMKTLPKVEGLVPIFINPNSGEFSGNNIRLGSRGDSYYEYLLKVWLQKGPNREKNVTYLYDMYEEAMKGVKHHLVRKSIPNGLVFAGELPYGADGEFSPKMDHLVCFLAGTLALGATKGITKEKALEANLLNFEDLENLKLAEDLAETCFEMYSVTATGLAPEIAYFHTEQYSDGHLDGGNKSSKYLNDIIIKRADRHNLLRPETVESLFYLYRITEDQKYREWGWQIFEAFEKYTRVDTGGYSSLDDVTTIPPHKRDKMETFFLGETLKYLYLLFGDSSHVPLDKYVFNTEAHPIPVEGATKRV